jgi:hypothetical protein
MIVCRGKEDIPVRKPDTENRDERVTEIVTAGEKCVKA